MSHTAFPGVDESKKRKQLGSEKSNLSSESDDEGVPHVMAPSTVPPHPPHATMGEDAGDEVVECEVGLQGGTFNARKHLPTATMPGEFGEGAPLTQTQGDGLQQEATGQQIRMLGPVAKPPRLLGMSQISKVNCT